MMIDRGKRESAALEKRIVSLQDRMVNTSELIEFESERERFLDMEIERLRQMLGDLRVNRTARQTTSESLAHTQKVQRGELKEKRDKKAMLVNETKARNLQLRTMINDLR